ncbi:T9SS type A sorting domain-containing protein [Taibaiella lutea]|uniref:T9SS type A sorting domain-containing protein n=1 Tax=Taibaiella lutea TaxID=2608001 RepID=A0A5M6CT45_9BACT|nr:T9SS type A sorting domain-containing protein [Taibaiella lutea]KAA5537132.1 T9SS type A sorting domain-containing protein [Taibaiella lutea]
MKNMKIASGTLMVMLMFSFSSKGQQVDKQVVVEHFTNTYCSVCASRNPGFYNNLMNFPQIIHIVYHPSSPYASCPFSQYNKVENDARTNFYGVFGGTPRLAIQGAPIPASDNYANPTMYDEALTGKTSFAMTADLKREGGNINLRIVVKKVDTSSVNALSLYAVVVEDTINFTGNNGETLQQDVFRKSFAGAAPTTFAVPANIGDSTVYTQSMAIDPIWEINQVYAIGILSTPDKKIEQAARSLKLTGNTTGIGKISTEKNFKVYPIPNNGKLYISGPFHSGMHAEIWSITGKLLKTAAISAKNNLIDIHSLAKGNYILKIKTEHGLEITKFNRL